MKLKRLRDIFLMFMACAFLGWIYEVPVGLLETHVGYVNRGFLFSPYLPIYCFGGIILIALLVHFVADTLIVILNGFHVPLIYVELIFGVVSIIVALFSRKIYVEES